jgi:hypothetical protein
MLIELLVTLAIRLRLHLYLPVPEDTALTAEKVQIGTAAVRRSAGCALRRQRRSRPAGADNALKITTWPASAASTRTEGSHTNGVYYPASDLFRVVRDEDGLQVDFMGAIRGVRSFEGVWDRAARLVIGRTSILVASLSDIVRSKRAANRPRDRAVLELLERALEETIGSSEATPRRRKGKPA